jgi:PAS domain S-box-containing protein
MADVPTPQAWAERAYKDASYRRSVMKWMWSEIALMQSLGKVSRPTEQIVQTKTGEVLTTMVGLSLHTEFLIISFQDITKERCAEAALAEERRKTEATAYALTENMPAGAYTAVMTPDALYPQFKFLSRKVLEIFDVDRATAEANPRVFLDRMHPEDRSRWFENSAEARRKFTIFSSDARVSVQGHTRWIRAEAAPRQISTGETLWEGIIVDITELKEAERRLQSVLVTAKAYAWRYNLKEQYTEICERWAELSGFDPGMRRLPYSVGLEKLHPDDTARVASVFTALRTGVVERQELTFRWLLEDGRWIWLRLQCGISARDETGEPIAISGISFDITKEMNRFLETQEAQAKLREDLQRAQQRDIVAQVAGRVVHDLNNLIFVISGTANMLDEISDASEELQRGLKRIRRAVELSSDLIGDQRWSCFFDQIAAQLRWIRFSYQAAILMGSVWLAWTSSGVKMPWVEWGRSAL